MIHEGQLIYVKGKGMISIDQVLLGDDVYCGNGFFQQVEKVKEKEHRGLTVKLDYHRYNQPLICSGDQKVWACREKEMIPKWVEIKSLLPRDFILMPVPQLIEDTECIYIQDIRTCLEKYYLTGTFFHYSAFI
ncbi:hypothetical protein [Bacillus sp. V5-8f]|uniref:hypothetical protein n=1 Tax=Bacillus sp. V5-8f TaxID=2053044 RepID=UPI000C761EE0|nr:hypothetical protein [Bacillus sp. V5-8f]PLT31978.1 hypothetical protein CUU64_20545 [Bacillus sp. V5-8f]